MLSRESCKILSGIQQPEEIMDLIDSIIKKALRRAHGYADQLIQKHEFKYSMRQREIADFFELEPKELWRLRRSQWTVEDIRFKNALLCLDGFLEEGGKKIKEIRYDSSNGKRMIPISSEVTVSDGEDKKIWSEASIYCNWGGAKYLFEVEPKQWYPGDEHTLTLIADSAISQDSFLSAFKEYCRKQHYLRGKKFEGISGKMLKLSDYNWDDLIWPGEIKSRIKNEIEAIFKNAPLFHAYGLNSKKGFIFAGDPGNGKTLLLKILAKESDATCIVVPFDDLKHVSKIFQVARDLAPTILIFEDIDLFDVDRDNSAANPGLGGLMNELDGIVENQEIVVIATTNRLEKVEKALQNRPGRFDRVYVIPNPDFETRNTLITQFIRRIPNDITPEQVEVMAEEFMGYSSSYLKELVNSGFAEAILRDPKNPVLKFCDMEATAGILTKKNGKGPIGFVSPAAAGKA